MPPPPPPPPPTKYVGLIAAVNRKVSVPYGNVEATVVEIRVIANHPRTERIFWVKNVGIVKREFLDEDGNLTQTCGQTACVARLNRKKDFTLQRSFNARSY